MDIQIWINLMVGCLVAAMGWFGRQLWEAVKELRRDIHTIESDLPKTYVQKEDYNMTMKRIEDMFIRIWDKLDGKADKKAT